MINAIVLYRLANFLYKLKIPVIPKIIKGVIFLIYNCVIPYEASIGSKTKLGYGGIGVVIHKRAVIGSNVLIGPNVVIGGRSRKSEVPQIGNNVYIGAGSCIIGPIKVGNNVIIGANAVVINNVPDNTIVAGNPARIVKENITNIYEYI